MHGDRITSGAQLVQEFCLTRLLERSQHTLVAEAVWHEDCEELGDASLVKARLVREGEIIRFGTAQLGEAFSGQEYLLRRTQ